MIRFATSLLLFFFLSDIAFSQYHRGNVDKPLTIEELIHQEMAYSFEFSPNGNAVVWVKRRPSTENDSFVTNLYLTRITMKDGGDFHTVQLTRTEDSDSNPFFSADGNTIYFESSRDDGKKLWALSTLGGEPYSVHTFPEGISDIVPYGDDNIAYVAGEGSLLIESKREEAKDNTIVVEDTTTFKPTRIFTFDLNKKEIKRLTDNEFPVFQYGISNDGQWIVSGHIMSPHYAADAQPPPAYYLWNTDSGERTEILEGMQTPSNFEFTEDGNGFYFTAVQSSDPQWGGAGISLLYYFDLNEMDYTEVDLQWENGLSAGFQLAGNDVIASLADGALRQTALYEKSGNSWNKRLIDAGEKNGRIVIGSVAPDNRTIIYSYSTASTPNQYWLSELNLRRRATTLNDHQELIIINNNLREREFAKTEIHTWTGANDAEINGILYYPTDYNPDKKYPLVVKIHGGPASVDLDQWRMSWAYYPHIYAQMGSFVLLPNYHGSSNHGQEFVESIKHRYYEQEVEDIVTGAQSLVDSGLVHADSMGIMGWSNGSILGIKTTLEYPEMFQVLGAGAGDVNWTSDYGTCRFGVRFNQSYFGGAPWDSTEGYWFNMEYIRLSPLFRMEEVITPTIIFFGSEDRAVPRDQGWEHYRALQQIGKADVRFLWFPGQPHSLQKITHQQRKVVEEIDWFKRYLFGTYEQDNLAFKDDSPLAERLRQNKWKRHNGNLGDLHNETLIPETLPIADDSISIGRFEVTNAQYSAFDDEFQYKPGTANYPVTGISLEQAVAYTHWLSELTGDQYRLPNAKEAESLHNLAKSAGPKQNTLNYLSGYNITKDEIPELMKKVEKLSPSTLLQEAGRFALIKAGDAEIYDLGGNAAEMYDDNGERKLYSYSVVSFVDAYKPAPQAPDEYVGFRVVKE